MFPISTSEYFLHHCLRVLHFSSPRVTVTMLSLISISFFSSRSHNHRISSPLSYKLWTEIKQSVVFTTNISLFLSPLRPPSQSPKHEKQSLHILGWREKTTRKMTSAPEKQPEKWCESESGGQRLRREKVSRKEGGRETEERKRGSRCFE